MSWDRFAPEQRGAYDERFGVDCLEERQRVYDEAQAIVAEVRRRSVIFRRDIPREAR